MSFPKYPKYKDSGVEWLGEVPEHWEVQRLKHCARLVTAKADERTNPVALENIEGWTGRLLPSEGDYQGEGTAFAAGDILFGKLRPYLAKVHLASQPGEAVGDFHVLRPHVGFDGYFARYHMLTREFIGIVDGSTYGSKMPRASWEFIGGMPMAVPPPVEQPAIATFLDRETAKIDALIVEQQRLIELLQEKRQAVISHAVTKGLNPDAPMKDSGIEWLGQVPEHWEMNRLGWICSDINDINHEMPEAVEDGVLFLSAKDLLDDGTLNFTQDVKLISEDDYERLSRKIRPTRGDIIYSRIGAALGKARLVETDARFTVSYSCCVVRVNHEIACRRFIRFLLDGEMILTEARMRTKGIGVPDLGLQEISRFPIPLPPLAEQEQVVVFLENETALLTSLLAESHVTVTLLQERRSALISAAVTGQIDVRGLASAEAA
jgi:type I restriction enzyme S subunit